MTTYIYYGDTLYHHGIKGQKWGIRRWQNEDGSLTSAGREHYGYGLFGAYKLRNAERITNRDQYKKERKAAKEKYKAAKNASYDRESKFETDVEKNYKRGQKLTDKDLKKEQDFYAKEAAKRAEAKARYKQEKKAAIKNYLNRDTDSANRAINNISYKNIATLAIAGVAAQSAGILLQKYGTSTGAQYVGAALQGLGQGTTIASISNAAYKYKHDVDYKKKK